MSSQFPLPFDHRPSLGGEDFLVSPCNAEAVAWIDRWPDWPGPALVITGEAGAGKSHLASVFAERTGARGVTVGDIAAQPPADLMRGAETLICDDADAVASDREAEQGLFHLLNHLAGKRGALLLTSGRPPARWDVGLRDLASRLNALPVAPIGAPDDALMSALLVKLFADRQVRVGGDVISYLVPRMERSFAAACRVVAAVDTRALASRRAVTVALVRAVLEASPEGQE